MTTKLTAKASPYSSVVGGGLQLINEDGKPAYQLAVIGTTRGVSKEVSMAISERIVALINEHGLEVPK